MGKQLNGDRALPRQEHPRKEYKDLKISEKCPGLTPMFLPRAVCNLIVGLGTLLKNRAVPTLNDFKRDIHIVEHNIVRDGTIKALANGIDGTGRTQHRMDATLLIANFRC